MKILFIHSLADPALGGGAEVIAWEQIRALREAGHECVLLATSDGAGLTRTTMDGVTVWTAGLKNVYWPYGRKRFAAPYRILWHMFDSYNPLMQRYIREVVERENPDVASLHNIPGWSSAVWSTLASMNIPCVQVLHDYYPICVKTTMYKDEKNCVNQCMGCRVFRLPHRALSRHVTAVVGVSRFMLEKHKSLGYFESVPIQRVIHNAREPAALGVDDLLESIHHSGVRFGYIGRLDQSKGIEILMDAFTQADLPDAELVIAGSGKQDYEKYLHEKNVDERIRFIGRVKPREFYQSVDVVVVPSLWNDNLPGVVFESFAFGKPVIGSKRGGIPEMIIEQINGLLFEPDTAGELTQVLERIYADEDLRNCLSSGAASSSTRFLDTVAWAQAYIDVFNEAIAVSREL